MARYVFVCEVEGALPRLQMRLAGLLEQQGFELREEVPGYLFAVEAEDVLAEAARARVMVRLVAVEAVVYLQVNVHCRSPMRRYGRKIVCLGRLLEAALQQEFRVRTSLAG